jgi:catechol 2,3-dioxygenase-like lactoylglutathione lyase family enzyme
MHPLLAVVSLWAEDVAATAHFYSDVIGLKLLIHILIWEALIWSSSKADRFHCSIRFQLAFRSLRLQLTILMRQWNNCVLSRSIFGTRWIMFYDPAGNLIVIAQLK